MKSEARRRRELRFYWLVLRRNRWNYRGQSKKLIFRFETAEKTENVQTVIMLKSFAVRVYDHAAAHNGWFRWEKRSAWNARAMTMNVCVWWSSGDARFIAFELPHTGHRLRHLVSSGLGSITIFHFYKYFSNSPCTTNQLGFYLAWSHFHGNFQWVDKFWLRENCLHCRPLTAANHFSSSYFGSQ